VAEPKKKLSPSRRGKRKAQQIIKYPNLSLCPRCKTLKPNYRVCPICGYYKGKIVLPPPTKAIRQSLSEKKSPKQEEK